MMGSAGPLHAATLREMWGKFRTKLGKTNVEDRVKKSAHLKQTTVHLVPPAVRDFQYSGFKEGNITSITSEIGEALAIPEGQHPTMFSGKPIGMQMVDPFYHQVRHLAGHVILIVDQTYLKSVYTNTDRSNKALATILNVDLKTDRQEVTDPKRTPVQVGKLWFVEVSQTATWMRHVTHEIAVFATEDLAKNFADGGAKGI